MSTQVRCDQCGQMAASDDADHWLHVMRRSIEDDLYPDLCTFACLAQWAIDQQNRKVAAK